MIKRFFLPCNARMLFFSAAVGAATFTTSYSVQAEDSAPADSSQSAPTSVSAAPKMVPNFQKVSEGIWRGAAPSQLAIQALARDGVKTIVDLRMDGSGVEKESDQVKHLGLHYYHFPLGFSKPDTEKLRKILGIMTDPVNQPVFIHCRQGADRTGMLVGLYRRFWQDWSFNKTWAEMRHHHFKPFLLTMKHEVQFSKKSLLVHAPAPVAVQNKGETLSVASPSAAADPAHSKLSPKSMLSDRPHDYELLQ